MVKPMGTEIALTTANTVGGAAVVRIFNNSGGLVLITRAADGTTLGTLTLASGEVIYIQKNVTETLSSNTAVRAASVAFN